MFIARRDEVAVLVGDHESIEAWLQWQVQTIGLAAADRQDLRQIELAFIDAKNRLGVPAKAAFDLRANGRSAGRDCAPGFGAGVGAVNRGVFGRCPSRLERISFFHHAKGDGFVGSIGHADLIDARMRATEEERSQQQESGGSHKQIISSSGRL